MRDTPALSDEADPLYRPLADVARWSDAPVDTRRWDDAVGRLEELRAGDRDWSDMVAYGARLAAAYQSAGLDGLYVADPEVAIALVRGDTSPADLDKAARAHVRANEESIRLAATTNLSEASIRGVHEVACRPQLTHQVWVGDTLQDHVLGGGDYKHHPNHVLTATGEWRPTAPVALVRPEMARFFTTAASQAFATLHPVAQAAYVHDALLHVQPFADGNGRVARALASGCLLRAAAIPLLVFSAEVRGVDAVQLAALQLVDVLIGLAGERSSSSALDRWRQRAEAGRALRARLASSVGQALDRAGPAWDADLSEATVTAGDPLVIRVGDVVETLEVDPHPLDGGPVVLTAREAGLRHLTGTDGLDPWLDRVVSTLALRVAADIE